MSDERKELMSEDDKHCPNEISCPKCGRELLDTYPKIVPVGYPPRQNIHCSNCDYKGYRVVGGLNAG